MCEAVVTYFKDLSVYMKAGHFQQNHSQHVTYFINHPYNTKLE